MWLKLQGWGRGLVGMIILRISRLNKHQKYYLIFYYQVWFNVHPIQIVVILEFNMKGFFFINIHTHIIDKEVDLFSLSWNIHKEPINDETK